MSIEYVSLDGDRVIVTARGAPFFDTVTQSRRVASIDIFYEDRPDRVRTRRPKGWLYPKPYRLIHERSSVPQGRIVQKTPEGWLETQSGPFDEIMLYPSPQLPSRVDAMNDLVMLKALQKLKDQRVNLGVALAEAKQTGALLGSTAARFGHAISNLRRGEWRKASQELGASAKKAPDNFLEWQYAWKPLMQDVHGAFDALGSKPREEFSITAKASISERFEETIDYNNGDYRGVRATRKSFRGKFVRLDFAPVNGFVQTLSSLGALNPAEILWEKVPYSFVLDWFTTFGATLGVLDATTGFEFISGSITDRRELLDQYVPSPDGGPGVLSRSFHGSKRLFYLERGVLTSVPTFVRTRFKNPFSVGHIANGTALLTGAVRRNRSIANFDLSTGFKNMP